jgi:hypothetical protein
MNKIDVLSLPVWTQPEGGVSTDAEELSQEEARKQAAEGKHALIGHLIREAIKKNEDPLDYFDLLNYYARKGRPLYDAFQKGRSLNETLAMARKNLTGMPSDDNGMVAWQSILSNGICLNLDQPGCGIGQPVKFSLSLNDFLSNKIRRFSLDADDSTIIIEILKEAVLPPNSRFSFGGKVVIH